MKAEVAREKTEERVDERIEEIYDIILRCANNAEAVAFVETKKLTEEMIRRLTDAGYRVDTYGSETYSIQW